MSNPQNDPPVPETAQADPHPDQPVHQNSNTAKESKPRKPVRLWPGVAILALQWTAIIVIYLIMPEPGFIPVLAGFIGGVLLLIWWLFFSRALWVERIGIILLMVLAVMVTKRLVHPSISGGGMGMLMPILTVPFLSIALVASVAAGRRLATWPRRGVMAAAVLVACAVLMPIRTGGITTRGSQDLHWRWTMTPEERLLTQTEEPAPPAANLASTSAGSQPQWPGFRGSNRDSVLRGVQIETNWAQKPPVEIWRRPVGPGWSSFSVSGKYFFTQEQRGDNEVVSCYEIATGKPVWRHNDAARFYESNAGAGPRGTPTLSNGRVYTIGATGIVNALDASNGAVIWTRNAANDTNAKIPHWGFASSPLIVNDTVIVATSGVLAAYDAANGNPRWVGPAGKGGYSSPHLATLDGVEQVLFMNGEGVMSVAAADGKLLWKHAWSSDGIVQPALSTDGGVLIGSGSGMANVGLVNVAVAHQDGAWTTKERWKSEGLMPYFNDFVILKDHAYGFDGSGLACIDLKTGTAKWASERYANGQVILLADQELLLVLSEKGELALAKATPDQFVEVAKFQALQGKTWNHPVVAGDTLLVRNSEQMAAYRLTPRGGD